MTTIGVIVASLFGLAGISAIILYVVRSTFEAGEQTAVEGTSSGSTATSGEANP